MKRTRRKVLRRESFGGIFYDADTRRMMFLEPAQFAVEIKRSAQDPHIQQYDVTEMGYPLLENALSSPMQLYVEITRRCRQNCRYCYANAAPKGCLEMSLTELEIIFQRFVDIGGLSIRLTGGEPTLRSDILEVVSLVSDLGLSCGINTNGDCDPALLIRLIEAGVTDFRISLDGTEPVNDLLRWNGGYAQVLAALQTLSAYNSNTDCPVDITINTVLMRPNLSELSPLIELAHDLKVNISFGLLRVSGRARMDDMLSPEEIYTAVKTARALSDKFRLAPSVVRLNYLAVQQEKITSEYKPFPFDNSKCPIGSTGCFVNSYGNILACGYLVNIENGKFIGENLLHHDLLNVWHASPMLIQARRILRTGCRSCEYHKLSCNGGCPMMAYVATGDLDGQDPYCIRGLG